MTNIYVSYLNNVRFTKYLKHLISVHTLILLYFELL